MLNLDQVRLLENRVEKAVTKIKSLTDENTHVRSQLTALQARVNELEGLVRSFKDDQGRIEEGILNALDRLSAFEDSIYQTPDTPASHDAPATDESIELAVPAPAEIDAEWQNSEEEKQAMPQSSDGQMDIF